MLKAFAHHLLIDAQAGPKQWPLASFPLSLYTEHLFSFSIQNPVPATGKKSNSIPA